MQRLQDEEQQPVLSELALPTLQPHPGYLCPFNHWVPATLALLRSWNRPGPSCLMQFPPLGILFLPVPSSSSSCVPANSYLLPLRSRSPLVLIFQSILCF